MIKEYIRPFFFNTVSPLPWLWSLFFKFFYQNHSTELTEKPPFHLVNPQKYHCDHS